MTSRRQTSTAVGLGRFLAGVLVAAAISACAALPDDAPVVEQLDAETGATVARIGRPMELYRETFLQEPSGKFAYLGPFETNQMGKRELYLWLALPIEAAADSSPTVEVNGTELTLEKPGTSAEFAGIHASPYRIPTPWSSMYYFKIDDAVVSRLADATHLAIRVLEITKKGSVKTLFATDVINDPRLKDFSTR